MSSRRHEEDWQAIGIDLGTSYSCVGIWRYGHVDIIPNDQGSRKTPSCVAFTDTQRLIGEAAVNQGRTNSSNTIYDVKRLIGRRFTDEVVQKDLKSWPFKVINGYDIGKDDKPLMVVTYMGNLKTFRAEEISAMVLMKLKDAAEAFLGKSVKNVVLTVPAYFNDSQRQATEDAGVIAGLNVLHLLNEPTAAALAYDFDKKIMSSNDKLLRRNNVLVFDLGGGSFDVSLVCIENGKIEVKSVNGDTHLGGSDFDNRMVHYFVEEFKAKYKKDASQYPRALERLRLACEKAKRALSLIPQTSIEIDYFCDGIDFSSTISRACFENLNDDLFKRCISLVDQCLYNAQISKQNVDEVILVGGSTRIPKVQQLLQEFFNGKELSKSINPDEAVAYGAALYGGFFSGITDNKNMAPVDVTPLSIHVKEISGTKSYIIPRNTTIPTRHKPVFGNENNGRRGFLKYIKKCFKFVFALCNRRFLAQIKNCFKSVFRCKKRKRQGIKGSKFMVYEGERHETEGNNLLGSFDLSSFNPPSNFEIDIDTNGILSVLAKDSRTGNMSEVSIMDRSILTMQDVVTMTSNAKEYKAQDKKHEEMVKAKNTLEDYANAMSEKLSNSSQKPKDKNIRDEIEHVLKWLEWNSAEVRDAADYMTKLHELESICRPIQGDS